MKKYLNISLIYAIAAMVGGVFYREFTKMQGFGGVTALGKVHTHLFLLGMLMFMVISLFAAHRDLTKIKLFRIFMPIYNAGVSLTAVMMVVRGIAEVLGSPLSKGASAAISGIAGIGHMLVGAGIILLILSLKRAAKEQVLRTSKRRSLHQIGRRSGASEAKRAVGIGLSAGRRQMCKIRI